MICTELFANLLLIVFRPIYFVSLHSYGGDSSSVASYLASGIVQLVSTDRAFAALSADGDVFAWGDSSYGGDNSLSTYNLRNVISLYSTASAFAAVRVDMVRRRKFCVHVCLIVFCVRMVCCCVVCRRCHGGPGRQIRTSSCSTSSTVPYCR